MDAFYASVEQRDNPQLRGRPVIVGGHPQRGVVLAASYEVRPFGVKSAIPMARALKLAPQAVVVAPRFAVYAEASEAIHHIFERYTPLVEPLSLDEAFLDVTASLSLFGAPSQLCAKLRDDVRRELGLNASAGIASVKFVSKIASDLAKPNGQREVPAGSERAFLAPLPVSRLWGVGPKTEDTLKRLGLHTIGDVAGKELDWLARHLGSQAQHFFELSHGLDTREVVPDREAKSIGARDTFEEDLQGEEALKPRLHSQALRVARRMRRAGVKGRCVQLAIKYADFSSLTRQVTLEEATDDGQTLYRHAAALLAKVDFSQRVRLTGVSASDFAGAAPQLGLFETQAPPKKSASLNKALDAIASKYGNKAVLPADLKGDEQRESLTELRDELL